MVSKAISIPEVLYDDLRDVMKFYDHEDNFSNFMCEMARIGLKHYIQQKEKTKVDENGENGSKLL
mgnify:CR=1 FL=1|jgi:hypothetical protein|tara:strand:+ start:7729 stop:7923 length:195 start_codon:yes stop_codon:yes gene_type:complete